MSMRIACILLCTRNATTTTDCRDVDWPADGPASVNFQETPWIAPLLFLMRTPYSYSCPQGEDELAVVEEVEKKASKMAVALKAGGKYVERNE